MRSAPGRFGSSGWLVAVLVLLALGLSACGIRHIPGVGAPSPPAKRSQPPAAAGKGGTYKPYTVLGQTYYPLGSAEGYAETGVASWYGPNFHGKRTANGEIYDMHQMTAAHRILPMHTRLLVVNLDNGRSTEVRVNDRGPFVNNRVIDLSYAAANVLGVIGPGTARVSLQTIPGQRIEYVGPFYVQYGAFVVEENALAGGFGSAVVELLADRDALGRVRVRRLGVPDSFVEHGSQKALRARLGLNKDGIMQALRELCGVADPQA